MDQYSAITFLKMEAFLTKKDDMPISLLAIDATKTHNPSLSFRLIILFILIKNQS